MHRVTDVEGGWREGEKGKRAFVGCMRARGCFKVQPSKSAQGRKV